MFTVTGKFTNADIYVDEVEATCLSQIQAMVNHPTFTNPVRIMPDTHAGKGSVIGFTMPLGDSIIPNLVGVDIGCGVAFARYPKGTLDKWNLLDLDARMREKIPFGPIVHKNDYYFRRHCDDFFQVANETARNFVTNFNRKFSTNYQSVKFDKKVLETRARTVGQNFDNVLASVGSLGSGNHYIEWGLDRSENVWFSVHTGSRHFGLRIATYHQKIAAEVLNGKRGKAYQDEINRIRSTYTGKDIEKKIKELRRDLGIDGVVPKDMEYLKGVDMFNYLMDMILAQTYADLNRSAILAIVNEIINVKPVAVHETVHNYINFEDFVIRKGAVRSCKGQLIIIPINMAYGSLLCEGKSNPDWNYSAPHGAGRLMSRNAAKANLDIDEFKKSMEGIASTSVGLSTLDEAPNAYKDPEVIKTLIEPTALVVDRIVPVLNMKDMAGFERC